MQTICQEMGFSGGEFWNWVDHLNDTKQMLWERPGCEGIQRTIKDCPNWSSRQMGAGVCGMSKKSYSLTDFDENIFVTWANGND